MAKKGFIKDLNDVEILPITRGELIIDSSGKEAFHSNDFLATTSLPGLMSAEDKNKLDNLEGGIKYDIVSTTADGLAPKINTIASAITTQTDEWVLTTTKGATPSWRRLPVNAFLNRPISVNGTLILENNNTALNLVAGNNITLVPEEDTGKVTIHSNITNITGNAATADKLKNKVKLWGLEFDGSSDVSGNLINVGNIHSIGSIGIISSNNGGVGLRYNNDNTKSVVLSDSSFRPYNAANGLINLGNTDSRWNGIYGQSLDVTGAATFAGTVTSSVATGTAPFNVSSTTLVSNLNADMLDGQHASRFIGLYTRNDIGTAPNFDNPSVNGLFEIRPESGLPDATGERPFNGNAPFFSIKAENVMMQIAGESVYSKGWYIRGKQSANVTLEGVAWQRLVTEDAMLREWNISVKGNAATATTDIGNGVFIMYHRLSDNRPAAVTVAKWTALQNSGETADGVLIVDGDRKLVVATTEASLCWSSASVSAGSKTTTDRQTALNDFEGLSNAIAQITHEECIGTNYAPGYCAAYSTANANGYGLGTGKWWLPSLGELMMIYANMRKINYALSLINGATPLTENWYWSSTEVNTTYAWGLNLIYGLMYGNPKTTAQHIVRAVSAFYGSTDTPTTRMPWSTILESPKLSDFTSALTGVGSATKLKTARKLWGNDFDGSSDVTGRIVATQGIHVNTSSGSFPLSISRVGGRETTNVYQDDNGLVFDVTNDEKDSRVFWNFIATDTENSDGTDAKSGTLHFGINNSSRTYFAANEFLGNLNGKYINALTGYTKATTAADLVETDTLNIALGKLEYKADVAYSWYRSITLDDTDEIINKWDEVVDFVNGLEVDLTEEFVTRKTALIITGLKTFVLPIYLGNNGLFEGANTKIFRNASSEKDYGTYIVNAWENGNTALILDRNGVFFRNTSDVSYEIYHRGNLKNLSDLNDDVVSGKYLPLTGGTLSGDLKWESTTGHSSVFPGHYYHNYSKSGPYVYVHFYPDTFHNETSYGIFRTSDSTNKTYRELIIGGDGKFTWNNKNVLHAGNFNNYAPKLDGTGATGTWNIKSKWLHFNPNAANGTLTYYSSGSLLTNTVVSNYSDWNIPDKYTTIVEHPTWIHGQFIRMGYHSSNTYFTDIFTQPNYLDGSKGHGLQWRQVVTGVDQGWKVLLDNFNFSTHLDGTYLKKSGDTMSGVLTSTVADGTSPFVVASKTLVNNLNTEYLDGASSSYYLRSYSREEIGIAPNYDNPTTNMFFEVRQTSETPNEIGSKPYNGWYGMLSLRTSTTILQLAGKNAGGWYIRGNHGSQVTLENTSWQRLVVEDAHSREWDISVKGNATSTTKLQTPRKIWGNNFDGTLDITGNLYFENARTIYCKDTNGVYNSAVVFSADNTFRFGLGAATNGYNTCLIGNRVYLQYGNNAAAGLVLNESGHVGIGTTNPISKLEVNGTTTTSRLWINTSIQDHASPTAQCLVINSSEIPSGSSLTLKNAPGIGFHMSNHSWGSLVFHGGFHFLAHDHTNYILTYARGFIKQNSSDSYVLLGGGGHKAISDFLLKSELANLELSNNLTTITKELTVTQDWMDTGISGTDLATGTYIVLLSVSANNFTDALYDCFWSGILTWFSGKNYATTNDTETDEVLLHRSGHAYHNTLYLRTIMSSSSDGKHLRLLIAANKNIGAAYTYTFKFKRII